MINDSIALTDDNRFTPETQINCETRFTANIRYEAAAGDVDVASERLEMPCLISGMRNKNIGSDKKCYNTRRLDE